MSEAKATQSDCPQDDEEIIINKKLVACTLLTLNRTSGSKEYNLFTDELPPMVKSAVNGWTNAITAIAVIVRLAWTGEDTFSDQL